MSDGKVGSGPLTIKLLGETSLFSSEWSPIMPATHTDQSNTTVAPKLYVALELSWTSWKLALTVGPGQSPRLRTIPARNTELLLREIDKAKARFGLPADAAVASCYEAGRDGFWLHRYLVHHGIDNRVVDSASIEVNRRQRRAKSDALDATKLVTMLMRFHGGETKVWRVVRIPTVQDEDRRQRHRELIELKAQRTEHSNRIKGLLATFGLDSVVDADLPRRLEGLRQWDGEPLPAGTTARVLREFARWQQVDKQVRGLSNEQRRAVRDDKEPHVELVRRLLDLKGIGPVGAWILVREVFGWRVIKNRRELAGLAGLAATPYGSGDSQREQGISKAGNRRVRWVLVELAWGWLHHQPDSALSRWYQRRFGSGNARARKVGIVALARKLLIALWKYLEGGEVPEGAEMVPWIKKLNGRLPAAG
jgi:transposase